MDNLQVQEYLTQGAVLAGQGKHEEALAYYDKAEKENPMNIDVYLSKLAPSEKHYYGKGGKAFPPQLKEVGVSTP